MLNHLLRIPSARSRPPLLPLWNPPPPTQHSAKQEDTQAPFRFLDLPVKVRKIVYKHAFSPDPDTKMPTTPQLFRVCRQVNHEGQEAFYTQNNITVHIDGPRSEYLQQLPQEHRRFIGHVTIQISASGFQTFDLDGLGCNGLRYCFRLKTLTLKFPENVFTADDSWESLLNLRGLRWLPRGCRILIEGEVHQRYRDEVDEVMAKMEMLDEGEYARWQLRPGPTAERGLGWGKKMLSVERDC